MHITRRQAIATAATAPLVLAQATRNTPPPNIVYIMADDLGYADLSCYGRRDYSTPNIDRIASDGMKFMQAYANSSVCSATRTALITGRYQYRLQVGLEEPLAGNRNLGIPAGHPTLPSLLKKAGYGTTLLGKWHLGSMAEFSPLHAGYDHFFGFHGGGVDYFTHKSGIASSNTGDLWDDDVKIEKAGYMTDLLGDRAVSVVGDYAKAGRPFLVSLHFNAPHWPWEGPEDEAESQRLRGGIQDYDGGSLATYARMVTRMDMQVGRVLETLENAGIAQNTIVIFTSDNGGERFSDTWPFTGKKTELLEGGLRIPAIVRWPRHIPAGSTTQQVAITMDWLPTLVAAAGTQPDPAYPPDGMSLLPVLTAGAAPVPRKLYWRYRANAQRAVRDGDMKWLKLGENTYLFNVVSDPLERANLKNRQADVYQRLVSDYEAWNATMLPEDPKLNSATFTGAQLADHYGNSPK
ncbi:MAG TPA: sulfatase-like hydrolase/transferase [Bryobacteraceae bacterium]